MPEKEGEGEERTDGVLERARSRVDRNDLGSEHAHAEDVEGLSADVLLSHVNNAPARARGELPAPRIDRADDSLEAKLGADGGGGDSVLSSSRLGDDALLADPASEENLPDGVVNLQAASLARSLSLASRQNSPCAIQCG